MMRPSRPGWIHSPVFDGGLILGPPLAAVALVLLVPAMRSPSVPPWAWLVFVVFIDVAHVYSSLYRTYFDPDELARRRTLYLMTPVLCFAAGVVLYSLGSLVFWRLLAYVAVYHFVRQQYGFVMLYRHRAGERDPLDRRIDALAIYATMLYPLVFWHAAPVRQFSWFVEGDFVRLPAWTPMLAIGLYTAVLGVFAARQIWLAVRGRRPNWGKIGVVGSTAAVWWVGIVALDSDFAFTVTNVVAHGVPYMALVWLYGRRRWSRPGAPRRGWLETIHQPTAVVLFVGLLLALAYFEEGLWDVLVWGEHGTLFGGLALPFELSDAMLALVVPLLTVPQATHYVLDGWIWKFDGSNPDLRENLFGPSTVETP